MQAEAALNARCTQSGPTGLQREPMGRQFLSRLSLHSRTSRSRVLNAKRTILLPFSKQYRAWVQIPAYPTDFTPGRPDSTLEYAAAPGSVMQRRLVALAAVLFRLKECDPECNRFSPFLIHISSMLANTRETDATESGTRI
ncbi:unnamed protein product [Sphagnum tenellum]